MRRRDFITLVGGAAATWPLAAGAQQSSGVRRIGVLIHDAEADPAMQVRLVALREGLQQLGWSEPRNLRIEYRFSNTDPGRLPQLARELVALNPEVIFVHSTPAAMALQLETRTLPIVFVSVSDPIGSGLVASLARPGGNVTGFLLYEEGIIGKWLGMLKEIAPGLGRVALVANPKSTPFDYFVRSAKAIGSSLGIELVPTPVENAGDVERGIELFAGTPNGGLVLLPDALTQLHLDLVLGLAARYRLPAVFPFRFYVTAGGLMSYGTDIAQQNREAASYIDRILRGAKAADLPVQAPTRYETTVNLKTAKALGLDVPPTLLVRADELIE